MAAPLVAALLAVGLAAVHLLAGKLRFLQTLPRSIWLSWAGGVSVAYVFVHLLPAIAARQALVTSEGYGPRVLSTVGRERLLFVTVLAGFALFFGVERVVRCTDSETENPTIVGRLARRATNGVFWLHVATFALINAIIGYLLLHREETGLGSLLLYATAMGLHFLVNDYGLYEHHRDAYATAGRWLLAVAVLAGFVVGYAVRIPQFAVSLLLAFLAGGIVLNVIKEELPEERESRFSAFAAGVVGYTAVLLLV